MAYCTQADLEEKMGVDLLLQLTDLDNSGEIDDDKVTSAIARADGYIDGFCSERYTVPMSPVDSKVKEWSKDLAEYFLKKDKNVLTEDDKENFKLLREDLKLVEAGRIKLGSTAVPQPESGAAPQAQTTTPSSTTKTFTASNLDGFLPK